MLNFGISHTISGLSKQQNLVIVLYANLLLLPTVYKIIKNELVFSFDNFLSLSGILKLLRRSLCSIMREREREREREERERETAKEGWRGWWERGKACCTGDLTEVDERY
jgi:hypothetical protein